MVATTRKNLATAQLPSTAHHQRSESESSAFSLSVDLDAPLHGADHIEQDPNAAWRVNSLRLKKQKEASSHHRFRSMATMKHQVGDRKRTRGSALGSDSLRQLACMQRQTHG